MPYTNLEIIQGRPYILLPGGQRLAVVVDIANSSQGLGLIAPDLSGSAGGNKVPIAYTGGTVGNFVIATGPTTVVDADPTMKTALRNNPLMLKVANGGYRYLFGALPMPGITATEAAYQNGISALIALAAPATAGGQNWVAFWGNRPDAINPTLDPKVLYYELGRVAGVGQMLAMPQYPLGDDTPDTPVGTFFEDFHTLADQASPDPAVLAPMWAAPGTGVTLKYSAVDAALVQTLTDSSRRAWQYTPAGQFVDGTVRSMVTARYGTTGKQLRAFLGLAGTAGQEVGLMAYLTPSNTGGTADLQVQFYNWVNNAAVTTVLGVVKNVLPTAMAANVKYAIDFQRANQGETLRARAFAYDPAGTVPDWQYTNTTALPANAPRGAGYAGAYNAGAGDSGVTRYHSISVSVGDKPLRMA